MTIEICLTIDFFQIIYINLLIKYSLLLEIFLSIIEKYLLKIRKHITNSKKTINRKIAINITCKFDRKMLKETFAEDNNEDDGDICYHTKTEASFTSLTLYGYVGF